VLALFLLVAATVVWALFCLPHEKRLDAIRKQGYPVSLSELNAWYKPVLDGQNNARVYEAAFALPDFGSYEVAWLDQGGALSVQDREELTDLLAIDQTALRLLHSAQATNRCRYRTDLNQLLSVPGSLNNHFKVIAGVRLLTAEALLHAADGNSQPTVSSFLAAGLLADSLTEEPLFISQVVRVACWNRIARRLQHALALTQITEHQLASLQAMTAQAEQAQALLRGIAGERAFGISAFADPVRVLDDSRPASSPIARLKDHLKNQLMIGLLKVRRTFDIDRTFYLDTMAKSVTAASLPFPERLKLGLQIPSASPPYSKISLMMLPRISQVFASEAEIAARLRAAQMALAVERFRRANGGRLPATLEELVPAYCKAVPADPFDGKGLRFRIFATGYVIYSVGSDGNDDGGAEPDPNNSQAPGDIGFRVEWGEPLSVLR
jgi:hypothetical protein